MDDVSRSRENDWFRENEKKLLEEARKAREAREAERKAKESAAERQKLKDQHYMKCPKCGLAMRGWVCGLPRWIASAYSSFAGIGGEA